MEDFYFVKEWIKNIFRKKYFVSAEIEHQDIENSFEHYQAVFTVPFYVNIDASSIERFIRKEHLTFPLEKVEILCISKL